jgi:hypothetical protein
MNLTIEQIQALYKLYPQIVTLRGVVAYDADGNEVAYDKAAVDAYIAANEYKSKRAREYPPITEQLDKIFHDGIEEWKKEIQAVKDKYPKGE